MIIKPTEEQKTIFYYIDKRKENIIIKALAGSGKSSTIVAALKLLPKDKSTIFLAFNKHMQEDLKTKLPENIRCMTMHGLGLSAIKRVYGSEVEIDEFKIDKILKSKSKKWKLEEDLPNYFDRKIYLSSIKKLVDLCRMTLTLDAKYIPYLIEKHDISVSNVEKTVSRTLSVLEESMNNKKVIDFTDMIFFPAIDNKIWFFPNDYVFIDECFPYNQHISTENGKIKIGILEKMFNNGKKLPLVESYNEKTGIFEKKEIKKIWCNGKRDIYQITVGGKRKIKSTLNHKFLTLNGWKKLCELKIGDAILSNYSNQPYHPILNESQKNIFIGSTLGDGALTNLSKNVSKICIIHSEKQKEYIKWKSSFFRYNSFKRIENNGYSKKTAYVFTTRGFFYEDNYLNKYFTIDNITPKSLAISWMDDGTLSKNFLESRLYSCSYDKNLSEFLSKKIENTWGIKSCVRFSKSSTTKKEYYWLSFNKENTEKISELISKYIHPSMSFKICPQHIKNIDLSLWNCVDVNYGCMVVTKEFEYIKTENVYDMEVKDNHNFIITSSTDSKDIIAKNYGFIAHNCQDINRAQQKIIEKVIKRDRKTKKLIGRLIGVGDNFQNIYGFSGVDQKTFDWFLKFPNTKILPLTHSFRCGVNIINEARKIVSDIKPRDNAHEGIVRQGNVLTEAQEGDFILCRTTAPLIVLFFELLGLGKKCSIKGSDIGISLIEMVDEHKTIDDVMSYWRTQLDNLQANLVSTGILDYSTHSGYVSLNDKYMALMFLSQIAKDVDDLKHIILTIFREDVSGIILSTVHKAKGLEADRVFIVRPDLLPMKVFKPWQAEQEKNLHYVAITRAKNELIYDYNWTDAKKLEEK